MNGSLGVSLLLPFSIYLDTPLAIGLLIGVYKAGMFAGSISAISFSTSGTPAAGLDVFDGYPLMKQGKCKKAIISLLNLGRLWLSKANYTKEVFQ